MILSKKTNKKRFNLQIFNIQSSSIDWWLLGTVALLCLLGIAFLASALAVYPKDVFQLELARQIILGLWLGLVAAFVVFKIDYHFWFGIKNIIFLLALTPLVYLGIFIVIVIFTDISITQLINSVSFLPVKPFVGGGAISWITMPFLSVFQPTEFAKLAVLLFTAAHLNNKPRNSKLEWSVWKKPFYAFLILAFLVLIQPDLGGAILLAVPFAVGLWVAELDIKYITTGFLIFLVLAGLLSFNGYRRDRFEALFSPDQDAAYQIRNSMQAISSGGMFGKGYGNSSFKQSSRILEANTDGIIAVIGEEMGFIFLIFFILLYWLLLYRCVQIAKNAPDIGGSIIASGVGVWIIFQSFTNIGGLIGLIPLTGVPLPFISQGGTSMVINLMSIGLVLNVSTQRINLLKKDSVLNKISTIKREAVE